MNYTPLFNPQQPNPNKDLPIPKSLEGDSETLPVYVFNEDIELAVNVALATGRPLLLRGAPGSGKSSLARAVAHLLRWRYYEEVITSQSRARDLQWRFDALRRIQDAQIRPSSGGTDDRSHAPVALEPFRYVEPGILWWALSPSTARYRGQKPESYPGNPDELPVLNDPGMPPEQREVTGEASLHEAQDSANQYKRAVVLLDEIDKADPDMPNNLLVVLGSRRFRVDETGVEISGPPPLVFITTNGERELPDAFLRRCVVLTLAASQKTRLMKIGRAHFPLNQYKKITDELMDAVYNRLASLSQKAEQLKERLPSTAEFLDALRACDTLNVDQNDPNWEAIMMATLWKLERPATSQSWTSSEEDEPSLTQDVL